MSDAALNLPDDSANTGKKLDAESLTVGAATVYRERAQLAGAAPAEIAAVKNVAPALDVYAVAVRPLPYPGASSGAAVGPIANPGAGSNTTLAAASASRRGLRIRNENPTAFLFFKYGAGATVNSYTDVIPPLGSIFIPGEEWTGQVDGFWQGSATDRAMVTSW